MTATTESKQLIRQNRTMVVENGLGGRGLRGNNRRRAALVFSSTATAISSRLLLVQKGQVARVPLRSRSETIRPLSRLLAFKIITTLLSSVIKTSKIFCVNPHYQNYLNLSKVLCIISLYSCSVLQYLMEHINCVFDSTTDQQHGECDRRAPN
jgi:hypothetical protein